MALRLCRSCGASLTATFVDLGMSPLANAFIHPEQERAPEAFYPLHVYVCNRCFLVQVEELASPEKIFTNYIYFSSYSETWLDHCARYVESIVPRLGLTEGARVVEIASNDGALLGMLKRYNLHARRHRTGRQRRADRPRREHYGDWGSRINTYWLV